MARDITRRQIIAPAPTLAAIPAAVALASEPEDRTFALIEAHRAAEKACDDANSAADLVALGRPATVEELQAAEDALVALDAAAVALCEYAPPTLAGSQAKAARLLGCYLVESQEEIEGPIGALARSIALMARAAATPAAAPAESEIPTRFQEWWNEWLRLDGAGDTMSDGEHESALNALMAVSDEVLAQPATSMRDVAAKVIIDTRGADFGLEPPMLAELYALSGLRRPSSDPDGEASPAPLESEVLEQFRGWDEAMTRYAAEPDDDLAAPIFAESLARIDAMLAIPSASISDFAAKVVAVTNWIDRPNLDGPWGDAIMADAVRVMNGLGFAYRNC